MRELIKPVLKAPTIDAVVEYAGKVRAYNKAACKAVDAGNDYTFAPKSGTRDKLTGAERTLANKATFHDYLADYPQQVREFKKNGFTAFGLR